MSEKKYFVYKHTCVYNWKVYIGITNNTKVEYRWRKGSGYRNNKHFYRAIEKYGWDDGFIHEVLYSGLSKEEAEKIEKDLIRLYKSNDKEFGYNLQSGGCVNYTLSEEGRRHISESKKGKMSEALAKHMKERAAKASIRIVQIDFEGKLVRTWNSAQDVEREFGWSASSIRKCCRKCDSNRKTAKGFIWMSYDEYLTWDGDLSYWLTSRSLTKEKKVRQISVDGETLAIYNSQSEAARAVGVHSQNISLCCCGGALTAGGYRWEFV